MAGNIQSLKERTLGIEVFGRAPDYDTSQDPVVRATAAEIRKKLAQYYQEPGHESESHIELLSGSYVVEFHFHANTAVETKRQSGKRYVAVSVLAVLSLVAAVATGVAVARSRRSPLDQLWAPLLQAPGPALICVGQPIAYNLKSTFAQDAIQGIIAGLPPGDPGSDVIHREDLLILSDRYVDLGDAVSMARLAALMEKHGKLYHIRGERSTTFADLSDGPSVLIGAFNNEWTLRIADQLRFTFFKDSAHEVDMVRDRQHPDSTAWRLTRAWPYWDIPVDFAIASRVFDPTTNRPVIIAAGITRHGTMAAGEFVTNPEYFAEAAARLPAGWQKKNLQIVLSVPVVNRVPGRPRVVATWVW